MDETNETIVYKYTYMMLRRIVCIEDDVQHTRLLNQNS